MMGQLSGVQEHLFYSFNLDKHVPADHLLRGIDRKAALPTPQVCLIRQQLSPISTDTSFEGVTQVDMIGQQEKQAH